MIRKRHRVGVASWCVALLLAAGGAVADAGDDPVVVRAGATEVRAAEISTHLAGMHPFERKSFGTTDAEVKLSLLKRKLVPEALVAEAARVDRLHERPEVRPRVNELLVQKLRAAIMSEVDSALSEEEIRNYCLERGLKRDPTTRGAPPECARDHLSYRIALRREKAHGQLAALEKKLRDQHVRAVDTSALLRIDVTKDGVTAGR